MVRGCAESKSRYSFEVTRDLATGTVVSDTIVSEGTVAFTRHARGVSPPSVQAAPVVHNGFIRESINKHLQYAHRLP